MGAVAARVASAPGRVNLLGEHIDHQGGTVLPVAVQLRTTVHYTPGEEWSIVSSGHDEDGDWTRYVRAVIAALDDKGLAPQPGRIEIESTVPEARGLASSAALEVAVAGALCELAPLELAQLCRRAENEKVGVPCGLMDQALAACAIAGNVLVLDCADETFFHLPLPDVELLLFDTGQPRNLADTPYAERREEAATAGTPAAQHVEGEKERVARGIALLDAGDVESFGALLFESHASLRDLYRCTPPVHDDLVEQLSAVRGVYGARTTGAGWGGCVIALAERGMELQGATRLLVDDGLYRIE